METNPNDPDLGVASEIPESRPLEEQGLEERLLNYWRSVEIFSPQSIPKPHNRRSDFETLGQEESGAIYDVKAGSTAPWESTDLFGYMPPSKDSEYVWRYQVYCGIFLIASLNKALESLFGKEPKTYDGRGDGETCLFSVCITAEGRPLLDTFVAATCAWGLGRLRTPGPKLPQWLDGYSFDLPAV
jgi:hypothetical protein